MEDNKTAPFVTSSAPLEDRGQTCANMTDGFFYVSDEKFEKAHRKTSVLHADLFRRLAE